MMKRLSKLAAVLLAIQPGPAPASEQVAASAAPAQDQIGQPSDIISDIRALYALQDAAASGHLEASGLQRAMLRQIDGKLASGTPIGPFEAVAQNLAGYVLSGGNPKAADRLAEQEGVDPPYRRLLRGAALYMRGRREEAAALLEGIDALSLRPSLAGRVALAQAMLETHDGDRRQALLAVAIAAMPGSLVEESALRRSALLYAESGNQALFWKRVNRYVRRFPRSIYAPLFLRDVVGGILQFESSKAEPDRDRIDSLLSGLPRNDRQKLYLALARQAALSNHAGLAKFAARRAFRLAEPGGQEAQVAKLYTLIFDVTSDVPADTGENLRSLEFEILPPLERRLLEASLAVLGAILEPAVESGTSIREVEEIGEQAALRKLADLSITNAAEIIGESLR
jgi:chemotaxis protein MotC